MVSYKAVIAYDGTLFFGWQKTVTGPSIQQTLEEAILRLTQEESVPEAASRTDRGVHAEGQVISFSLKRTWEEETLLRGLNAHLPSEIRVLKIEMKEASFHPTLHAVGKEYHYRLCYDQMQDPIYRLYSWHFPYSLQLSEMEKAAQDLEGTHDFSAFANEKEENPICTVKHISFTQFPQQRLQISLIGDRFLYKMARTLVGTLLYVGCKKICAGRMKEILADKRRENAGVTAPALGLFLHQVFYE